MCTAVPFVYRSRSCC